MGQGRDHDVKAKRYADHEQGEGWFGDAMSKALPRLPGGHANTDEGKDQHATGS